VSAISINPAQMPHTGLELITAFMSYSTSARSAASLCERHVHYSGAFATGDYQCVERQFEVAAGS
jgi:hypothetical protein